MGGVSSSLPVSSSAVFGTHPHAFVFPSVHQGEGSGGGDPFSCREGCCEARSSSFSGLLQPVVRGVEDLWVLEAGDQYLCFEPLGQQDSSQDGDPCFGSSVGSPGRLDGLFRPQGGLLAGSHPSGQPQVPEVCGLRQGVSVLRPLLRPLDRTTGLHKGYGSCIPGSPRYGYSPLSVSRRLAHSGFVSGGSPLLSQDCLLPMSRAGHSCESGEIQLCSGSTSPIFGHCLGFCIFQGFSFPVESKEASFNRRQISVLQAAALFFLSGFPRRSLLPL